MNLDASQRRAVAAATSEPFAIITGGAGTGKTTIIRTITETLEAAGETVALAAFAGKAAARIREACTHPASTIHRLLQYDGRAYNLGSLAGQSIIIDEASMIDAALLAEVVRRRPRRLILVGDEAQLAPVGRGQPFHDLIRLRPDLVCNLTTCYRATEAVFQAATAIRGGGRPPLDARSEGERWTVRNTGAHARTQETILGWVTSGAWDWQRDIVLVARNGETDTDPCTVRGLNAAIVDAISPRGEKVKFVVGDRVMNTKNLPAMDVWNGTTGTVHAVDQDGGVWVRTDIPVIDHGKTKDQATPVYTDHVLFGRDVRGHLRLAYAMTVHKSQGSEYRNVLIACFRRDVHERGLLDRSLLYTAVTRTRAACCVCGEVDAAWRAIDRKNVKRTVMQELEANARNEAR